MLNLIFETVPLSSLLAQAHLQFCPQGAGQLVKELISVVVCVLAVVWLRCKSDRKTDIIDPWEQILRSLGWGTFTVTMVSIGLPGIARYCDGKGLPAFFSIGLSICLGSVFLIGIRSGKHR